MCERLRGRLGMPVVFWVVGLRSRFGDRWHDADADADVSSWQECWICSLISSRMLMLAS